ncbi:hypothetical protein FRB99_008531 [Tulasnella sp. 403]|nr:hypothetical protein FRB99_008531 [Tulasnella sp. 403]
MRLLGIFNIFAITTNLFRIGTWIYLRVFPIPHALVPLMALYIVSMVLRSDTPVEESRRAFSPNPVVPVLEDNPQAEREDQQRDESYNMGQRAACRFLATLTTPLRFLFALPSKSRWIYRGHLIINTLLALFVLDFTYRFHLPGWHHNDLAFVRVTAVHSNAVKLQVRYPPYEDPSQPNGLCVLKVQYREVDTYGGDPQIWRDGPELKLRKINDWINVTNLTGLWPEHTYEFQLAKLDSTPLPYPSKPLSFRTFPDPKWTHGTKLKFIATSGVRLNFPYAPVPHANRFKGFDILAKYFVPLEEASRAADGPSNADSPPVTAQPPTFALLIGDLVRRRSSIPFKRANINYARELRNVFASPSFRRIYENIPVYHAFGPSPQLTMSEGSLLEAPEPSDGASGAFGLYSRSASYWGWRDHSYYEFRHGDIAFFVLDTLTYRSSNDVPETERSLLGTKQLEDLFMWAAMVNQTSVYKIVVSPVPLSALWGNTAASVTWADFPSERARIVDMLSYLPNAIVVSGGRHEFAAIEYLGGKIMEVVTGPISSYAIPAVLSPLDAKNSLIIEADRNEDFTASAEGFDWPNEQIVRPTVESRREEAILHRISGENHVWSTFDIDTTNKTQPSLILSVYGRNGLIWSTQRFGQPVTIRTRSTALTMLRKALSDLLSRMGFKSVSELLSQILAFFFPSS